MRWELGAGQVLLIKNNRRCSKREMCDRHAEAMRRWRQRLNLCGRESKNARGHRGWKRQGSLRREREPCDFNFRLWPPDLRENTFLSCWCQPPGCGDLFWQPQETNANYPAEKWQACASWDQADFITTGPSFPRNWHPVSSCPQSPGGTATP